MAILVLDESTDLVELNVSEVEDLLESHLEDYEDLAKKLQKAMSDIGDNGGSAYVVLRVSRK
jgi:hypothetical protein